MKLLMLALCAVALSGCDSEQERQATVREVVKQVRSFDQIGRYQLVTWKDEPPRLLDTLTGEMFKDAAGHWESWTAPVK